MQAGGSGGRTVARAPGRAWTTPFRIAVVYALVGVAWVLFSDRLVAATVSDPALSTRLHTAKGWAFTLATAALLFVLIRRNVAGLRQRDAEMRAALEGMADAVLVVSAPGRIVDANPAAVSLLGARDRSELLLPVETFHSRFQLRHGDGTPIPPAESPTSRALAGETLRGFEALLRRAGGTDVVVGITASAVPEPRGRPRLAVAVLRDMTELRRFEEMRDEFLSTAAHEFKTPLAVVKAYAQLLRKREAPEAPPLEVIDRQVERLNRLVQQLLEVSRFRIGGPELRRERYDLAEQVSRVTEEAQRRTPSHRLRLEERAAAPVIADRRRIEQVLVNLLDNAVKFSPGGGDVRARVSLRGGEVVVSVQDAGVGIPRDRQSRVFERYYRAHLGTAHDYGGIGVGLDMSREIVARHGGSMWFESAEGVGSTFSFSLPLAEGGTHG